jgi:hypothetical protein
LEPVSDVPINAAWSHFSITMNAYDASDNLLESDEISATTGFKPMRVSDTGISKVVIGYSGRATLLLDDMIFVTPPEEFRAETLAADPADPSVLCCGSQHCGYVFCSANTGGQLDEHKPVGARRPMLGLGSARLGSRFQFTGVCRHR